MWFIFELSKYFSILSVVIYFKLLKYLTFSFYFYAHFSVFSCIKAYELRSITWFLDKPVTYKKHFFLLNQFWNSKGWFNWFSTISIKEVVKLSSALPCRVKAAKLTLLLQFAVIVDWHLEWTLIKFKPNETNVRIALWTIY